MSFTVLRFERVYTVGQSIHLLDCDHVSCLQLVLLNELANPGPLAEEVPGAPIAAVTRDIGFYRVAEAFDNQGELLTRTFSCI
ncbi:MAG: hypothetical protein JW955_19225 [Sedimentisphaerales bacterium]|nr:hypothetical protein [Sedimentisphaerales bacterium]